MDQNSQQDPSYFDQIVQRDMSGVYKQFGGLGTAEGRRLYAMYNKEESATKRAQYNQQLGTKKPSVDPHSIHQAKIREKYEETKAKKNSFQAPLPQPKVYNAAPRGPYIPHRRSQAVIEDQMRKDFPEQYGAPQQVKNIVLESRESQIERLQNNMEVGHTNTKAGRTQIQTKSGPKVRAGQMAGRRTTEQSESELFQQIVEEIQEREKYVRDMRQIHGPDFIDRKVDLEIKDRIEQMRQLEQLLDQ